MFWLPHLSWTSAPVGSNHRASCFAWHLPVPETRTINCDEDCFTSSHPGNNAEQQLISSITMPAPTYIISRVADPIFAVVIGLGAAAGRINREQKEKGKTTDQTIQDGLRYVQCIPNIFMVQG
jgi:hypothetical protein